MYEVQYLRAFRKGDIRPDLSRLNLIRLWSTPQSADFEQLFSDAFMQSKSASTRNRYRALINHIMKWALKHEYVNGWTPLQLEKETNQRMVRLPDPFPIHKMSFNLKDNFVFSILTGIRRGALTQLEMRDIRKEPSLILRPEIQKDNVGRVLPLHDRAYKIVKARELVFSLGPQDKIFKWNQHEWDKFRKDNNLQGIRWHDIRHEFACRLLDNKVTLPIIQRLLGHADIKTTMRYLGTTDTSEEDTSAIQTLSS